MPHRRTDHHTFQNSRELRQSPTPAEAKLWRVLRMHQLEGLHVRRQHAIGPYVVDFCIPQQKLIIELDGSQHFDQEEYDEKRTAFLASKGYRVMRFWNNDVMENLNGVILEIREAVKSKGNS